MESVVVAAGGTEDNRGVVESVRDGCDGFFNGVEEVIAEEEVAGRVAGEREFGEDDEVGAELCGAVCVCDDAFGVSLKIADNRVEGDECEAHWGVII